ncbi:MAG: hypothetical protein N3D11_09290 [Candidatus Sumerlaeia bacterium]|nr:hypothetical protein [Candidatus Sumerlaeia bacterium]
MRTRFRKSRVWALIGTVFVTLLSGSGVWAFAAPNENPAVTIRCLTSGPRHHFFGYYGITPWNQSQTHLVCLESEFQDHLPRPDEAAAIGLVDAKTGAFTKVGETRAWNFQQGAMLHWNPLAPDREIIFNDRKDGDVVGVVLDVNSGQRRWLARAVSAVSHNGRYALSLTYGRLTRLRPVVGYVGTKDPNPDVAHPDNDGVFLMDLQTGEAKLVVSIGEVYRRLVGAHPELRERHMWFNHTVFNKDDTRFFFLARCWEGKDKPQLQSAMFTCNLDGSDLREVIAFGKSVSHFEWKNSRQILATFDLAGTGGKQHVLFTDGRKDYQVIGEGFLSGDGHPTFSPDEQWIANDRNNSKAGTKSLMLFHLGRGTGMVLGSFPMKEYLSGDLRCDLHPRWNRTGDAICFDALDTRDWTRQLHVAQLRFAK